MRQVPKILIDFINHHDCFYILGHREPDGDCIGSQLALASMLQSMGKRVHVLSSGPFNRIEILRFEARFKSEVPSERDFERTAAIVLDCSSMERIGSVAERMPNIPASFIDHHSTSSAPGPYDWLDESASAVSAMILLLMEAMGHSPTREEAELLFFGLCTDTGFFRHLDEHGSESLKIAARLVEAGVSPKRVYMAINGGRTLASRRMLGELLLRIQPYYEGRLLVSWVTIEDQQRYGMSSRDSDLLYQLMMGIVDCEVCFVVKQETEEMCTVGLRSKNSINVARIAEQYGGGGHRLAAGLSINGKVDEVVHTLVRVFGDVFRDEEIEK
ncbi:MAG TPA: bifunctional oligoribonuclease/PAP phosphatase NrnA [Rectinema sp.]|jgi:phosphoesterase RecJ-like protein|nr:bifunctional oligoribonuclease/PAP phosphatase NrnA [Spirochaetia bacterium]MDI9427756.1 bifunctional oligoribonuclease/PAP phosphatase NrnA [Spirochaetota bacterium]NLH89908.1 bifunctional oligoribonuclease/PAP phosphatase NrnA [Treponema sp.]OQC75161.1 MAG: Bifunctional oligoribonuclease and PAP phosphatase NrnA [Spirochaetes bacterium ADurb.Bin001]HNP92685.1 bifunctional oligoribonuclease/PAP phosphatase NrnA [Rectinema sp.]